MKKILNSINQQEARSPQEVCDLLTDSYGKALGLALNQHTIKEDIYTGGYAEMYFPVFFENKDDALGHQIVSGFFEDNPKVSAVIHMACTENNFSKLEKSHLVMEGSHCDLLISDLDDKSDSYKEACLLIGKSEIEEYMNEIDVVYAIIIAVALAATNFKAYLKSSSF